MTPLWTKLSSTRLVGFATGKNVYRKTTCSQAVSQKSDRPSPACPTEEAFNLLFIQSRDSSVLSASPLPSEKLLPSRLSASAAHSRQPARLPATASSRVSTSLGLGYRCYTWPSGLHGRPCLLSLRRPYISALTAQLDLSPPQRKRRLNNTRLTTCNSIQLN